MKKDGFLLFAENLEGCLVHKIGRKIFTKWGKSWNYLKVEEIPVILKDFYKIKFRTFGVISNLFPYRLRDFFARMDPFLEKLMPPKWRIIASVVAFKK